MTSKFISKLRYINPEMIASLMRTIAQVGGGIMAQRGWANGDEASTITGALALIAITIWGVWARSDKNLILSTSAVPAVHNVEMDRGTELESLTLIANAKVNAR